MRFVKVDEVPKTRGKNEMRDIVTEFMNMKLKTVKVEDHGYRTAKQAYMAFRRAIVRWAFPIDVHMCQGEVYLIRRDM